MSALPQALPLAISASFYPPALLVLLLLLTGKHPAAPSFRISPAPRCSRAAQA
jgi:hypothetical protein